MRNAKPDILHLGAALKLLSPPDVHILKDNFLLLNIMRSIPLTGEASIKAAQEYDGTSEGKRAMIEMSGPT